MSIDGNNIRVVQSNVLQLPIEFLIRCSTSSEVDIRNQLIGALSLVNKLRYSPLRAGVQTAEGTGVVANLLALNARGLEIAEKRPEEAPTPYDRPV